MIQLDYQLFWLINNLHSRALDYLMLAVSWLGEYAILWWLLALIILFLNKKEGRKIALLLALAILLTVFIDDVFFKLFWFRERPFLVFEGVHRLGKLWQNSSFPSGHASSAMAGLIILGHYYKKWILPLAIFVLLTLYSRVYLGMHYPSDVLVGGVVGLLSSFLILYFFGSKNTK